MPEPLRSAEVYETIALMAALPGRSKKHWAVVIENARLYQWLPDDTTTADGWSIVASTGGGSAGRWKDVPGDLHGADLDDSDGPIAITGKPERDLPTLARSCTKTLGVAGAAKGHKLVVTITSNAAFTVAFVNGGPGAGTITTKPSGQKWWFQFRFDGADWRYFRAGQLA